jgi:hypothetical protein
LFAGRNYRRVLGELSAARRAAFSEAHIRITQQRIGATIAAIERKISWEQEDARCAP